VRHGLDGLELRLEVSNGPVRLGEFVDLEALHTLGPAGVDQGLALPEEERRF
jgi:hypothetical protein